MASNAVAVAISRSLVDDRCGLRADLGRYGDRMGADWGDIPGWVEAVATVAGFGGILFTLWRDRRLRKEQERQRLKDACNEMLAVAGTVAPRLDGHRAAWMAWLGSGTAPFTGALRSTPFLRGVFGEPTEVPLQPTRILRSPREAEAALQLLTGITDQLLRTGMAVSQFHNEKISDAAWALTETVNAIISAYEEPSSVREEKSEALHAAMAELRQLTDQL